jgi:predicted ATPase/DNA-binding CsgD family transcriptional regulator
MTLPTLSKAFIGRRRELAELVARLSRRDARIVTLTGFGGIGKTTLACVAAREVARQFEHGVTFVPLAQISDPELVASQIARVLELPEPGPERQLNHALLDYLRDREMLLVLDNFEHLQSAGLLVSQICAACPDIVILVTSQRRLDIDAQHVFTLDPLSLPGDRTGLSAESVRASEAVLLFEERARAARADFAVSDSNAADVAEICRTLDGIPLAIELAAARVRSLGTRDLLTHLQPRMGMVAGGAVDNEARLRTLEQMIGWSHQLLNESQRRLFRRLSVFSGGFTIDAARHVTSAANFALNGDSPAHRSDTATQALLDDLDELASLHLIVFHPQPDNSSRYEILETIREFGAIALAESGEEEQARIEHASYFLDLLKKAEQGYRTGEGIAWTARLEPEIANIRQALQWFLTNDTDRGRTFIVLSTAAWSFWRTKGMWPEAIRWLEAGIQRHGSDPSIELAKAWLYLGNSISGDQRRAQACYEESLRLFELFGDPGGIAVAVGSLAMLADLLGEYDRGKELARNALERLRALPGDVRHSVGLTLIVMADLEMNSGHLAEARPLIDEALAIWQELDSDHYAAVALWRAGKLERLVGQYAQAVALLETAVAKIRRHGDRQLEYMALCELGLAQLDCAQPDAARQALTSALQIAQDLSITDGTVASVLEGMARVLMDQGQLKGACRLFAATEAIRARASMPLPEVVRKQFKGRVAKLKRAIGTKTFETEWTIGKFSSLEEIIAFALEPPAPASPAEKKPRAKAARPGLYEPLAPRELEALCELVKGKSDRAIGEALGVSIHTSKTWVERVRGKLGVSSRYEAALIAVREGWCPGSDPKA